jgi:hypothetical protein
MNCRSYLVYADTSGCCVAIATQQPRRMVLAYTKYNKQLKKDCSWRLIDTIWNIQSTRILCILLVCIHTARWCTVHTISNVNALTVDCYTANEIRKLNLQRNSCIPGFLVSSATSRVKRQLHIEQYKHQCTSGNAADSFLAELAQLKST